MAKVLGLTVPTVDSIVKFAVMFVATIAVVKFLVPAQFKGFFRV